MAPRPLRVDAHLPAGLPGEAVDIGQAKAAAHPGQVVVKKASNARSIAPVFSAAALCRSHSHQLAIQTDGQRMVE